MYGSLNDEVVGTHSRKEFMDLVATWGWRCFYCARPICERVKRAPDQLTEDHLTPLSRGGVNFIWNIVPACLTCNELKGMLTAEEFRSARPGLVQGEAQKSTEGLSFKKEMLSNLAQQTVNYLKPLRSMEEKPAEYYQKRRELLKQQTCEILRLRQEQAGQMTLPIFGDNTPKKLCETETAALTLQGMHVTERKA